MNIFVVDSNPHVCAVMLDDLRLNKMIIETAQLLCTAIRHHGYTGDLAYKSTHINHPCAVWARANRSNYNWLNALFYELYFERVCRFGKGHKSYDKLHRLISNGAALIPDGEMTPWPNCSLYKDEPDLFEAYKKTMCDKWANDKRPPKWTTTQPPAWKI